MNGPNPLDYGWWLASRSSGIVALLAVSISVIIGLMMANGLPRRPGAKRQLVAVHESTALAGLIAIAIHGVTLLGDSFMHPTIAQIAIPFTMSYRPLYTGLGVIAGWGAAFLGLSFYARRWFGARRWRTIHRATIGVWALAVIHTLGSGTDATQLWMRVILVFTGVPIIYLFILRLMPGEAKPARRARPAASSAGAER
ncbi:MAG: hypothetical protein WCK97_05595 [Actinomycetes bacterium]